MAHSQGGVPNVIVNVGGKGPRELGRLIYFFEYACGLSGYLLDVNPFDQPGVERIRRICLPSSASPATRIVRQNWKPS